MQYCIYNLWFVQTGQTLIERHMKKAILCTSPVLSVCLSVRSVASTRHGNTQPPPGRLYEIKHNDNFPSVLLWMNHLCIYLLLTIHRWINMFLMKLRAPPVFPPHQCTRAKSSGKRTCLFNVIRWGQMENVCKFYSESSSVSPYLRNIGISQDRFYTKLLGH